VRGKFYTNGWIGFDGQKLSKDNPISVEWEAAAAPDPATTGSEPEVYENTATRRFAVPNVYATSKGFSVPSTFSIPNAFTRSSVTNLNRVPIGRG